MDEDILKQLKDDLEAEGLSFRDHQLDGLKFMINAWKGSHGCILADEMGLGKTCQSIGAIQYMDFITKKGKNPKFLIICPLSVLDHWHGEVKRFGSTLKTILYRGPKEEREELRQTIERTMDQWNVFLTTYEMIIKDQEWIQSKFHWSVLIVDEAHRLKNSDSLLYTNLTELNVDWWLLLTGTPIQNNLTELYSLLHLCAPDKFKFDDRDEWIAKYSDISKEKETEALRQIMARYMLRRTKDILTEALPHKSEVVLYHHLSSLQKDLYKAILTKNYKAFESDGDNDGNDNGGGRNKQSLMNTMMQLRKCVNHPYLFNGVEPEPFEEGEHLIESCGKLQILDKLLKQCKADGHRVLLFTQMTRTLDILQDYLTYRKFSYERLDGSVRGEERFAAVQRFSKNKKNSDEVEEEEAFVFLLSTRAGGLGLTLTSADTVVFYDSDFNPQNDLQAAARAHRIGQTRPVKVIRLVTSHTVEEVILKRAKQKLRLTQALVQDDVGEEGEHALTAKQIRLMLTEGLAQLNVTNSTGDENGKDGNKKKDTTSTNQNDQIDLAAVIGPSLNGEWLKEDKNRDEDSSTEAEKDVVDEEAGNIYEFDGKDYKSDRDALDKLMKDGAAQAAAMMTTTTGRHGKPVDRLDLEMIQAASARKPLTPEQLEERRRKREEAKERRRLKELERKEEEEKERIRQRKELWHKNDYKSAAIPLHREFGDKQEEDVDGGDDKNLEPIYVHGDVAHPNLRKEHEKGDTLILHTVDDSGDWCKGGVFRAISARSCQPEQVYKQARRMRDLLLGQAHVVPVDELESRGNGLKDYVVLLVAQDRKRRGAIKMEALKESLQHVRDHIEDRQEKDPNAVMSVHLPRIGYGLPNVNWYGIERLIRKELCTAGIPTYIYYFKRGGAGQGKRRHGAENQGDHRHQNRNREDEGFDSGHDDEPAAASSPSSSKKPRREEVGEGDQDLSNLFTDMRFKLIGFGTAGGKGTNENDDDGGRERIKLKRVLLAYDGEIVNDEEDGDDENVTIVASPRETTGGGEGTLINPVTPKWITDAIAAGNCPPTNQYRPTTQCKTTDV